MPPEGDTLVLFLSDELEHEVGWSLGFEVGVLYGSRRHQGGFGLRFLRSRWTYIRTLLCCASIHADWVDLHQ